MDNKMKIGMIKLCFVLASLYFSVDGDQQNSTEVSPVIHQWSCLLDWWEKCFNISSTQGADMNETGHILIIKSCSATEENLSPFMDCIPFPTHEDSYLVMVSRCDNSTTKSNNQQQQLLCEGDSRNETITSVPVVLKTNQNIIFRNIFCAFCHGYKLKDLETQEFYYECEANVSFTSQEEIKSGIEQNLCTLKADESKERTVNIVTPPMAVPLHGRSTLNPVGVGSPNIKVIPNFKIFFDFKEDSWSYCIERGQTIPATIECPNDQVYFIYIGDCQPLLCPLDMYPYKGQCLLRDVAVADRSLLLFPNGTHQMSFHVIIENISNDDDQVGTAAQNITETVLIALNETTNITMSVSSFSSGNKSHWSINLNVENVYNSVRDMVDETYRPFDNLIAFLQTEEVTVVRVLLSNINETLVNEIGSCSTGLLTFESQNLTLEKNTSGEYFVRRLSTFYPIDRIGFTLQLYPTDNTTVSLVQAALCVLQDPEMPLCHTKGATMLSNASFKLENGILVVLPYGKRYTSHEFVIRSDGNAVVCNSSPLDDEKYFLLFRFYLVEQLATFACLLVSIVSLLLVLLTYSLLPQLRNVPGVIVMSLSASMLTMQVLMLLVLIPRGWLCLIVAWLLHWSLLATFLWNSALAFDLAFTLTSQSFGHMSKRSRGRILWCYIMLCWLLPLLFVVSLGVMDHYGIYDVGYATGGQCCIGTRSAILWLVIAPMSLTLLFNCACFVCAFSTIFHTAKLMQKSTTSSQGPTNPVDKRRLFVYIRITLIMGFTWAVGFTAAFVQLEELWIANIVLNASQGLYFLIAFVLKRRVWSLVWDRFSSLRSSR